MYLTLMKDMLSIPTGYQVERYTDWLDFSITFVAPSDPME